MPEPNLFLIFTQRLKEKHIPYAVSGSVACIIYGEPRMTHDIDIVIDIRRDKIDLFVTAFSPSDFYCPPAEVIKTEILRENRGHCNLIHLETAFKADIYFTGNNSLQHWAIVNARQIEYNKSQFFVAPPEYVIVKKLEFYREGQAQKHLLDVKGILRNSSEIIDFKLLGEFIEENGLGREWKIVEQMDE